jgi:predicted DNA-binding protein
MVVKLRPETESRLQQLAATTGREPAELVVVAVLHTGRNPRV